MSFWFHLATRLRGSNRPKSSQRKVKCTFSQIFEKANGSGWRIATNGNRLRNEDEWSSSWWIGGNFNAEMVTTCTRMARRWTLANVRRRESRRDCQARCIIATCSFSEPVKSSCRLFDIHFRLLLVGTNVPPRSASRRFAKFIAHFTADRKTSTIRGKSTDK